MRNSENGEKNHITVSGSLSGELFKVPDTEFKPKPPFLPLRTGIHRIFDDTSRRLNKALGRLAASEENARKQLGTMEEHRQRVQREMLPSVEHQKTVLPPDVPAFIASMMAQEQDNTSRSISFSNLRRGQESSERPPITVDLEQLNQLHRLQEQKDIRTVPSGELQRLGDTTQNLHDEEGLNGDIQRWFKRWHKTISSNEKE